MTLYDTSYNGGSDYLGKNHINRCLINATAENLILGVGGLLTIKIQQEQPENPVEQANWLPALDGSFYLTMRIYWPEQATLDGTWTPPPVDKA